MKRIVFLLCIISCGSPAVEEENAGVVRENVEIEKSSPDSVIEKTIEPVKIKSERDTSYAVTITNGESGFGYDIYFRNELMIRQPIIPAVEGNKGFSSEADAKKVADLMVEKLSKGISPPSVTIEELKKLGIFK